MVVTVKVKFLGQISEELGAGDLSVITENSLPEAVKAIERATGFPLESELDKGYGILVNGRSYYLLQSEGLVLKEGDKLVILPKLGGG